MTSPTHRHDKHRVTLYLVAILLVGLAMTVPTFVSRDLWNPDEPRYAEVAREMVVMGDYFVPHLNGEIYAEKPPMFFWLSGLLQQLGFGMISGRIVVTGFNLGTLYLVWALARLRFNRRTALVAALVLCASPLFTWFGRVGVLDVPLTFFTTLAIYGFFRHRIDGGKGIRWIGIFYVAMGLAVLTKGPVGILFPTLMVLVATVMENGWRGLRARHALWGIPLLAAVVGAWLIPAVILGGEEYRSVILFKQNLGRVVSSWSHSHPWHYYLGKLPLNFFPWFIFLPWVMLQTWSTERDPANRFQRVLTIWAIAGVVVFSMISGKREQYLLPLFPVLAILVAGYLETAFTISRARRSFLLVEAALLPVAALPLILLAAGPGLLPELAADKPEAAQLLQTLLGWPGKFQLALSATLMLACVVTGVVFVLCARFFKAFLLMILQIVLLSITFEVAIAPKANVLKSHRAVAAQLDLLVPPGVDSLVALYPDNFAGAYNLHTKRLHMPVLTDAEGIDAMLSRQAPTAVLADKDDLMRISDDIRVDYREIEAATVGHRRIVFLVRRDG
jgi:4-amino-4-deoxy-L-arabinose transferase-like glycosyltransferase